MRKTIVMIAAGAALVASCANSPTGAQCSNVPIVTIVPDQIFVQVRDTITITAHFGPICPGAPGTRAGVFFWRSTNPAIVTIDSLTGLLHGIAPGQTTITATDTLDHSLTGAALVGVTARVNGG